MTLPTDPYIPLSYINTKLRDEYPSLESLCDNLDIDAEEISQRLSEAGFSYNPEINQFR